MKRMINHIHQVSLGLVLMLTEYRGETILDTCLNYCFDKLFYMLHKIGQTPNTIRQMTGAACIVFFILLNLKAHHLHTQDKISRIPSPPTIIKEARSDLEKWGSHLLKSIDLQKTQG